MKYYYNAKHIYSSGKPLSERYNLKYRIMTGSPFKKFIMKLSIYFLDRISL